MRFGQKPAAGRTARRTLLVTALAAGGLAAGLPSASAATAAPASTRAAVTGSTDIAYQSQAGTLQIVTPDGTVHSTGLGMMLGTSPSIAAGPGPDYRAVMQANSGVLWKVSAKLVGQPQRVKATPGTSPSVSFDEVSGKYQTFFESAPGKLGHLSGFGGKDLYAKSRFKIDPGTSPSTSEGNVVDATAGTVASGSVAPGFPGVRGTQLVPGTSPSGSYVPNPGGRYRAAVAWEHDGPQYFLSYAVISGTSKGALTQTHNPALGMEPGTSPAIAIQPGGDYEVAFQSNQGELWIVDSHGVAHNTRLGMDRLSSPAITALDGGGFEIAFQANNHALWTVDGTSFSGQPVPGAQMSEGTSPSISAFVSIE